MSCMETHADVDEVPVSSMPVIGAVLTHRRLENLCFSTQNEGNCVKLRTTKILFLKVTPRMVRGSKSLGTFVLCGYLSYSTDFV